LGELLIIAAVALIAGGALYMRLRWRRAPQAYRAMLVIAACYFVAGSLVGAWVLHLVGPGPTVPPAEVTAPSAAASPLAVAPTLKENYTGPSFPIPQLHYDPAHAVLPDPKLTPGDVFPDATKDDICTPGWAKEHRNVAESDKARVYSEYPDWRRTCHCVVSGFDDCCEVDHLIPLELGGSNDVKNLWPQPADPRPGSFEKDSLEDDLHEEVCAGKIPLADAQKCIASNWVECWEKYVVPRYGPEWAAANRHGW
jgi:hypothetical protein